MMVGNMATSFDHEFYHVTVVQSKLLQPTTSMAAGPETQVGEALSSSGNLLDPEPSLSTGQANSCLLPCGGPLAI
jgi:hypothetical protein